MEIPHELMTVFTAEVVEQDGSYVVEVPKREIELGAITERETYRIGLIGPSEGTCLPLVSHVSD